MIAIIDYKAGNLTSVKLAFEHLNLDASITSNPQEILSADHVVFPGVGAAAAAMQNLRDMNLLETTRAVAGNGTPFLGICLGTQIILQHSEENDGVECLGLIPGTVKQFRPTDPFDKVPQMGWNNVSLECQHPVFAGIDDESPFYFVHSYFPCPKDDASVVGRTEYSGVNFASAVADANIIATQFHPEKSGRIGLKLLQNFSNWDGQWTAGERTTC